MVTAKGAMKVIVKHEGEEMIVVVVDVVEGWGVVEDLDVAEDAGGGEVGVEGPFAKVAIESSSQYGSK